MSDSLLRQTLGSLFDLLSALGVLMAFVTGFYMIYAGLFGDPLFGLFDELWWSGIGVLTIFQGLWGLSGL